MRLDIDSAASADARDAVASASAPRGSAFRRRTVLAAIAFLLAGCMGVRPIEPKAGQLQAIRSIAVVSAPEPSIYKVIWAGHPAAMLGPVGVEIARADQDSKADTLTQALRPHAPATTDLLSQGIVTHLQRMGYEAQGAQARWNKADDSLPRVDLGSIPGQPDAVLVLEPRIIGFFAMPGDDYRPTVQAEARLYGRTSGTLILRASYGTGAFKEHDPMKFTATHLPPFKSFEALMADPQATALSLQRAAGLLAERVAQDFQR